MVEEELMTGADEEFIDSGSNETVDRDSDILLVPFVEVMDQCLYAPRETQECVDFDRHGPSLYHAITRRYVFMVVVLAIALWSLGNGMCLEAIGRIMNIDKSEENREVLNAVVSEITVLGFIALVSGVASRTNFLNKISPAVFGAPPAAGAHGDLFLLRLVGRLLLGEDPSPEDLEPSTAAAIERFPDIRDGRTLAELTVLFEDIHIGLFLIMMTLIILAVLNFYQVNSIVEEWERAESLIQRHAPNEAYQMLNTLVAKLGNGFHRGFRMRVYMMYISYRQEFLNPSTGVQPDGVDSVSFPFLEYLRRCAGAALVESVEVPLWMYAANGIMVLCVRPWLAMGNEGTCDVRFFVFIPYLLLLPMIVLSVKLTNIMNEMYVDPNKLLGIAGEGDAAGRRFAIKHAQNPPTEVKKAKAETLLRGIQQYTHGTLTPTPFERLFWFQRCGIRFLAVVSRLVLFWTSVYIALFILVLIHFPFTWMENRAAVLLIVLPLGFNMFIVYPYVTCCRILVTNTEYSPHRYAIRQLLRESAAEVDQAKQMLVAVFKREKMKGLVLHGKQRLEEKEIKELEDKFDLIPERTRHFIEKAYYSFDTNNDGYLNRGELQSCLKTLRMSGDLEDVALGLSASGLFRPASDEWFQILAPDLRGVNHAQFKVLIWGLLNTSGLELNKDELIQALTHLNRGDTSVNADAIQKIVLRLTRLQEGISHFGSTFMQEMYFFKKLEGMLPEGYEATAADFADLIISWDHEFATQRGLE